MICLAGCSNNRVEEFYTLCMSIEKPVKINFLYKIFKTGRLIEQNELANKVHQFLPHPEYAVTYSAFITAEVDLNDQVVGLQCSEKNHAF